MDAKWEEAKLLADFVYESNAIEEIFLGTKEEMERDFLKKMGEFQGHVGAIIYLKQKAEFKEELLAEKDIQKVQALIVSEQNKFKPDLAIDQKFVGHYRNINVRVGRALCIPPEEVPGRMKNLVAKIRKWQKIWFRYDEMHRFASLADFHYEFEAIHPFADGNGRTGRAFILYLMLYMDKTPFVFTDSDKYLYYLPFQLQDNFLMRVYFYKKRGLIK